MNSGPKMREKNFLRDRLISPLLILLLLPWAGFAQQDLSDFEKRLARINEEIKALQTRIKEEEKRESTLLSQLDKISLHKRLIKRELALSTVQLERTSQELASLRKEIADLKTRLRREKQSMERTLVTLYKYGKFNFLQFLLEADNMNALFAESKHLGLLARYQQDVIEDYLATMSKLSSAKETLETKQAEITQLVKEAGQKKLDLEAQEAEGKALIRQIQKNKKIYEQALAEQNERAQHLQALMDKLASQEIVLPFRFVPFYEKKGKLPWPISGKVITRFGLERHPQFNTITLNNGIEISPPKDSLIVRSVHSGKVVYADFFQGYGNLLIIDHGMNYYSLYGHCAEFLVNKGDLIREEQAIAIAGDSGSLKGLSLYLEIRYKTKPLNPLQWLKRR